jgi:hypothetical protein
MKTIKKRIHSSKSKRSKKNIRKMVGGVDNIIINNTVNLLKSNVNYLQIDGPRSPFYTSVKFDFKPFIVSNLVTYGLNPGLGGTIVDSSQPYIIYFFVYYYIVKIFSLLFKMNNNKAGVDLFQLPYGLPEDVTSINKKEVVNDLDLLVGSTYFMFVTLSLIPNILNMDYVQKIGTRVCLVFKVGELSRSESLSRLTFTGIYFLDVSLNPTDNSDMEIIRKILSGQVIDQKLLHPSIPFNNEVRDKIKAIVLYSLDIEKQIISAQSSATSVRFLQLRDVGRTPYLKCDASFTKTSLVPIPIDATFLTFINKLSEVLKGNLNPISTSSDMSKLSAITENYIPNVLNIYLTTTPSSSVQLKSVLLKQEMFPPYKSSSNELQINPRYNFKKMKTTFTKQFCKTNKECYVTTLFSPSEFTKFNKQNKSGRRLQTIQQVTPNVTGNIEATLSLLLPNYTLKINGEEVTVTDYNWNHQWNLTGPKENMLTLQSEYKQSFVEPPISGVTTCYKNVREFYDDIVEIFYPSMAGKDITKIYGNYLKILSERNALLTDIRKFINTKTLTINTINLSDNDTTKILSIKSKSNMLNDFINKFVTSIINQLIIIGNITRRIINRIHTSCFFYFGFDKELYDVGVNQTQQVTQVPTAPVLFTYIPNIIPLITPNTTDILTPLANMYYSDPTDYQVFFQSLLCGDIISQEYKFIIESFSSLLRIVCEKLNKIAGHMLEIKNDTSFESVDLTQETLSILWINDDNIEKAFGEFEKGLRTFIKYNLIDTYYSKNTIEGYIDDIFWDMEKSSSYGYSRLFTAFVFPNVWEQFEILFSYKIIQLIFLIYKYTGKYVYYKFVSNNNPDPISDHFLSFLRVYTTTSGINLFTCLVNWFKYNCLYEIQQRIQSNSSITIDEIQQLFSSNELIRGSYTLLQYYITKIILSNLDVCRMTTELQTFVDILSPNDMDLKNIMPQTIAEKEKEEQDKKNKSEGKDEKPADDKTKNNTTDTKKLAYNIEVSVKVKKVGEVKNLTPKTIDEYLGCKNRDLQFKMGKLKESANVLTGDIASYLSQQSTTLMAPNISQLNTNLDKTPVAPPGVLLTKDDILSLIHSPTSLQITRSVNLSETRTQGKINFFVNVNKIVYSINKQTKINTGKTPIPFQVVKGVFTDVTVIYEQLFSVYDNLYVSED